MKRALAILTILVLMCIFAFGCNKDTDTNDKSNILYVSSMLTQDENGEIDAEKATSLMVALKSAGHEIKPENMYSSVESVPAEKLAGNYLYIFEGVNAPQQLPSDGMIWFINTSPIGVGITFGDSSWAETSQGFTVEEADSFATDKISTAIKENVDFSGGQITPTVRKYSKIADDKSSLTEIYKTGESPLVLAGEVNGQRIVVFTFDIKNSSLPFFVADFPVFMKNLFQFGDVSLD